MAEKYFEHLLAKRTSKTWLRSGWEGPFNFNTTLHLLATSQQ